MAYKSKFKGKEIDDKLDLVQELSEDISDIKEEIKNTIKEETDPVFSTSPAATITEANKRAWSSKQDAISDIATIREGASKGTTAVQPASLANYVSKDDVDAELSETSTNPVQNQAVMNTLLTLEEVLEGILDQKQPIISDLDAIRQGAAKGATALQASDVDSEMSDSSTNPIQNKAFTKEFMQLIEDVGLALESKQEKVEDLQTIREGAAKGATALQEHQSLKTINGETIVGEGNIEIKGGSADLGGYATEEYVDNAVKTANVKGEDGYVYSNGEKVDMRFTRSLIPVGTSIPAKANLNTVAYLKVGKYYCSLDVDAKTITNCPTTSAFSMEVFNPLSPVVDNETTDPYVYRIRILTVYNTGVQYVQYAAVGSTVNKWTYNTWYVVPRSPFTLKSNKKGGSAALGSARQGVYINSEGTFVKMSYTLGKSVPSSAVFTDTKVTAVGNHYAPVEDESVVIEAPAGEVVIGLKRDAAGHVVGVMSTPMSGGGGGGGGGITVENDPIFSASPAASITEENISSWDGKQDGISDLETIRSGADKGSTALQGSDTTEELDDVETNTYVKYVAQTLTDEQKNQVRENLGIPSVDYIISLFEELKTLINNNSASDAIAVLDKAILDMHKLQ